MENLSVVNKNKDDSLLELIYIVLNEYPKEDDRFKIAASCLKDYFYSEYLTSSDDYGFTL